MSANVEGSEGYRRIRRPKDKDDLITELRDDKRGAFREIRDVILFAGAVGFERKRYEEFTDTAEPIRWETWTNRTYTEEMVRLIAVAHTDDKEIAAADRQAEQIAIFEAYANGGLSVISDALRAAPTMTPLEVVLDMIGRTKSASTGVDAIIDLAGGAEL
jgi:dnd system-associated protein 4